MKNKVLYYILSFTWGLPMTLIGLFVAVALICVGYKPKRWGGCFYFNVGKIWGGVSLGIVFITDESDSEHTKNHEFGHSIQNCRYGLLMPFIVCIPSFIRYWYREFKTRKGIKLETKYDDVWFEGEATALGYKYIDYWEDENDKETFY